MAARAVAVAAGLVLDGAFPEPRDGVHPVALFGRAMQQVERRCYRDSRSAGACYALVGVGLGAVAGGLVRSPTTATTVAVAGRALRDAAGSIDAALRDGDLEGARRLLPALVGRDVAGLDAGGVARAVVESVAENTVDAVVAPVWWAVIGGAPGVLAYRAVNTMDAMVGYRTARYGRFGWASARLDDVAAFAAARVTAALVVAVRPTAARAVWRAVRTQAPSHPSPNAGVAEAAFAAALGVTLGGAVSYGGVSDGRVVLGSGRRPQPADIGRAVALCRDVTAALAALLVALALVRVVLAGAVRSPGRADRRAGARAGTRGARGSPVRGTSPSVSRSRSRRRGGAVGEP